MTNAVAEARGAKVSVEKLEYALWLSILNPEGERSLSKNLVKRDISFQSINFSTLFINVDLTCPATWCWWCSSWCPPWSGSSRRPRRCAATSGLAKVQSGPDGGGTMRLQKTESHRELMQDDTYSRTWRHCWPWWCQTLWVDPGPRI